MKKWSFIIFSILLLWSSCMPFEENTNKNIQLDFSDKTLQGLINNQDKRNTDSLKYYLGSQNPTYRYVAAQAFSSSKDPLGLSSLYPLLEDPVDEVRAAAIHAIGQIGDTISVDNLLNAFEKLDSLREFSLSNSQILEAVGKCGKKEHLNQLVSIKTYEAKDTLLLLGQARGIYRFSLRNIIHPKGTKLMVDFVNNQNYPNNSRLIAAHYLHRSKQIEIDSSVQQLISTLYQETDPNIRMALVTGIAKSKLKFAQDSLIQFFDIETDYRVKSNIIRAMSFYNYDSSAPLMYKAIEDKNKNVQQTVANYFYNNGSVNDWKFYRNIARKTKDNWRLKYRLYAAASKNLNVYYTQANNNISLELIPQFKESKNSYEKVAILNALSEYEWNYLYLKNLGLDSNDPMLKTAGTEGLVKILSSKDFDKAFKETAGSINRRIRRYIKQAIKSKDAGAVTVAASALKNPKLKFKDYYSNEGYAYLDTVLMEIPIPEEMETYIAVKNSIDYLNGITPKDIKPLYNHPIEWNLVENLNSRVRCILQTNKGKIILEFYHQYAPATVANFIRLVKEGYYDNKSIHRVATNFVIQGGCSRGDGYGSEPFTIRSELSGLYYDDEGYLGMASAGNDTESTQWFITHSPTPHLDPNYTIFGKVKEGMDIVHSTEIGDIIEKAVIKF